eukprot:NODE_2513_length_921_cov_232.153580.p2 GENE.NODE_2513_length_921_cov_232.153580~~NODE_2513_length_921_cov_232.153580.p2  ORF type:complete len:214 (+),score=53.38 NODE_2513_length_921_cov_232.153580:123-764(+)
MMAACCCAKKLDEEDLVTGVVGLPTSSKVKVERLEVARAQMPWANEAAAAAAHSDGGAAAAVRSGGDATAAAPECAGGGAMSGKGPLADETDVDPLAPRSDAEHRAPLDVDPLVPRGGADPRAPFEVVLQRPTAGTLLSFSVEVTVSEDVMVHAVAEAGMIAEWNRAHPDRHVRSGCRIVEVNGIRGGPATELISELQSNLKLKMLMTPPESH